MYFFSPLISQKGILVILASLLLTGCCTKKGCSGADDMDKIWFGGFENRGELDSIVVKRYAKGTGFATVLDSMVTTFEATQPELDLQMVVLPQKLTVDFDYVIALPSVSETWEISEITSEKRQCNTGFLCIDRYNALESYRVNGEKIVDDWKITVQL